MWCHFICKGNEQLYKVLETTKGKKQRVDLLKSCRKLDILVLGEFLQNVMKFSSLAEDLLVSC